MNHGRLNLDKSAMLGTFEELAQQMDVEATKWATMFFIESSTVDDHYIVVDSVILPRHHIQGMLDVQSGALENLALSPYYPHIVDHVISTMSSRINDGVDFHQYSYWFTLLGFSYFPIKHLRRRIKELVPDDQRTEENSPSDDGRLTPAARLSNEQMKEIYGILRDQFFETDPLTLVKITERIEKEIGVQEKE